jgi:anti-sigma factor RsiW
MTSHCSEKDWLLISRFLAGAISPRQAAVLESRLASDPDLREALLQLKRTRLLLSACPEKKVPHNFTISAGQTARRQSPRLFPVFRFATVVSSLLFAAVVGMRLFSINQVGEASLMMDMTSTSQESAIVENPAPKAAPPVDEPSTITPDARAAAGAGVLSGTSPSQEIPEEGILYEAEFVPEKEPIPWGNIALSLGITSLILASLAIYIYFQERI